MNLISTVELVDHASKRTRQGAFQKIPRRSFPFYYIELRNVIQLHPANTTVIMIYAFAVSDSNEKCPPNVQCTWPSRLVFLRTCPTHNLLTSCLPVHTGIEADVGRALTPRRHSVARFYMLPLSAVWHMFTLLSYLI